MERREFLSAWHAYHVAGVGSIVIGAFLTTCTTSKNQHSKFFYDKILHGPQYCIMVFKRGCFIAPAPVWPEIEDSRLEIFGKKFLELLHE